MLAPSVFYFERPLLSGVSSPTDMQIRGLVCDLKNVVMHAHSGIDNKLKFASF